LSYYDITRDNAWLSRALEDVVNRSQRHCRIGKVKFKDKFPLRVVSKRPTAIWIGQDTDWEQTYMDKCGCKVGSACGNVACPHRLTVTC
jgi:hypothetical protein